MGFGGQMWMGTYPSLPAHVLSSNEDLQKVLDARAEELIGKDVMSKFGTNLPFLPKVSNTLDREIEHSHA